MSEKPTYRYVTYIESTADAVWNALTDANVTAEYWGHRNESDWKVGSPWQHVRTDGSGVADVMGTVLSSTPPTQLVITFGEPESSDEPSRVTFDIEGHGSIVRLTVTHEDIPDEHNRELAAHGWAAVLSNLKSLLETGHALPEVPWEMPAS